MEKAKYLALEYGSIRNPACNVHRSQGTAPASRMHYHDFYQIYFLIRGRLEHTSLTDSSTLYSGDCFVIPPEFPHRIWQQTEETEFYAFSFRREFLISGADPSVGALLDKLTPEDTRLRISLFGWHRMVLEQMMQYSLQEFTAQQMGWETAIRGVLTTMLVLLSREAPDAAPRHTAIRQCIAYLDAHICEPVSQAFLLEKFHFSASTFHRSFVAYTGKNFRTYVREKRLDQACILLRDTDLPAARIAEICGFGDYAGFYRAFAARTKVSPREYRQYGLKSKKS